MQLPHWLILSGGLIAGGARRSCILPEARTLRPIPSSCPRSKYPRRSRNETSSFTRLTTNSTAATSARWMSASPYHGRRGRPSKRTPGGI